MDYAQVERWQDRPELLRLKDLPDLPKELYYSGTWDPVLFKNCVAVVGSRRMTEYGRRVIEKIVPRLVFEKKVIASGFMYGVDQYAHRTCLENGGKTIAILGWGIDYPLLGEDKKLARDIIERGGLLLSEWKHQQPTLWTFPIRNRIIVALSTEVIIIEAAIKSGSLITAAIAEKLKRPLWAVPGSITSPTSAGTNELIATGKALMWRGEPQQLELPKDPLLRLLTTDALTPNEIARKLGKSVSEIGAQLSLLALTGQLIERGGKYYTHKN